MKNSLRRRPRHESFTISFVRDFHDGLAEFTEEQVDPVLLDWWGRVADDAPVGPPAAPP